MKLLTDTWRQLVQRRLWPVAVLLLGALVAVPFVLGKSPDPVPVASAPAAGGVKANASSADPIVSMVSADDTASTRRSLGDRHNPFASSAPKPKTKKSQTSEPPKHAETVSDDAPPAGSGGGGTPAPTTPTTPTVPAPPTKTVPAGSIVVGWGAADGIDPERKTLQRDEALPDADDPALVFTGLKDGGKTAVFMVSEGLKAFGDGTCVPKATCETIELQAGDTEFFEHEGDVDSTQFELDLVKIYKHATKVPAVDESPSSTGYGTGSAPTSGDATTASLKAGRLR
jgi:hypothetical protein